VTPPRNSHRSFRGRAPADQIRGRATKFPGNRRKDFEAPSSGLEIPDCSSVRIHTRIPRSLPVIGVVAALITAPLMGYEQAKGQYVVVTDEDFAKARVPATQTFA
jgi:hypothetical protein